MIESKKSLCTCIDHCRIGSLERIDDWPTADADDHCRIGSLEIHELHFGNNDLDHCRIGSLEKQIAKKSSSWM